MYHRLGVAYRCLDDYKEATVHLKQSLTTAKETANRAKEAEVFNNLGHAYHDIGEYTQAIVYFKQSLIFKKETGERAGEQIESFNLSHTYRDIGGYSQAITYLRILYSLPEKLMTGSMKDSQSRSLASVMGDSKILNKQWNVTWKVLKFLKK